MNNEQVGTGLVTLIEKWTSVANYRIKLFASVWGHPIKLKQIKWWTSWVGQPVVKWPTAANNRKEKGLPVCEVRSPNYQLLMLHDPPFFLCPATDQTKKQMNRKGNFLFFCKLRLLLLSLILQWCRWSSWSLSLLNNVVGESPLIIPGCCWAPWAEPCFAGSPSGLVLLVVEVGGSSADQPKVFGVDTARLQPPALARAGVWCLALAQPSTTLSSKLLSPLVALVSFSGYS